MGALVRFRVFQDSDMLIGKLRFQQGVIRSSLHDLQVDLVLITVEDRF